MDQNTFKCAKNPVSVLGSRVATDSFSKDDVAETLHLSNNKNEFIGIYRLNDGRFASIFCKKTDLTIIGDEIIDESVAHVASSYENIVRLGLTDTVRDTLEI